MGEKTTLVSSLLAGYDTNFVVLIYLEIHAISLSEITTLPFHNLIQQFYDTANVLNISYVDHRIKVTSTVIIGLIKDLTNYI